MTDVNNTKLQQQYEGTRLAAAAYAAQDIKALLATSPSQHELAAGFHDALVKQGFSTEQANSFIEKYMPAAALDQDGAGAVLFRINGTNEIAMTVRGTEYATREQIKNDLVLADGTIALGELPVYQTTLIANFVLRETTPVGQTVPQFSVLGGNNNAADLGRATADTLANAGGERGGASNLVTMPVLVQTGMVIGTGNAVGPCVDAAAHSEGSPEITTLGSAIAQCSRITTVNGPGVSVEQMQSVSDQIAIQANRSFQDIASQSQLNVHTSGVSVIDGLNGGLPGDSSLLNIPGNSHSSIVAMNAAEAQYKASMGEGVADYGVVEVTAPRETYNLDNYLKTEGDQLTKAQQDALAAQLDQLNLGNDKSLSFYTLPSSGALIATADGDIVGEIVHSPSGDLSLKATTIDASGNTVEVNTHINEQGQALNGNQYADTQLQDLAQGVVLFNGLSNLQNWDQLSDVGKLSAMLGFYNAIDGLGAAFDGTGNNLPGDFAELSGWLNFVQGLQRGDVFTIANGINQVSDQVVDEALNSMLGSSEVPYVSALVAFNNLENNPAQSLGTLAGMYVAGPLGGAIGGFIGGAFGGLFGDDDIPMRQGLAHAQWDAQGQIQVITTQDAEGGGSTANSWMASLVGGLQTQLHTYNSQHNASDGLGLALIPNLLPSVGFTYDPDGGNLANGARGFMYLQWIDAQGHTQTRYYDGAGNRADGSGETLSGDFVHHAQSAIAPAWQVQTVLAHYQQSGVIELPVQTQNLPTALSDGLHQTLQVVSLGLASALPTEATPSNKLIDVDGDGYLEQTQWVQANQAILSVDLNGDGQISLGETVNLQDAQQVQQARTSLAWLDANQDARLTAQDPAFAAIRLWIDVNADGKGSATELQSLSQAGITAIDFSTNPPRIERADGSVQSLNVQTLTANTLGVAFQTTAAGLVQTTEQQDGTGKSVQYAVNTRAFEGQAAHTQGGTQDVDGSNGALVQVDASKLATTTNKTIANASVQTSTSVNVGDARLKSAATVSSTVTSAASSTSPETRVAFVPAGQNSAQSEVRLVTQDMIESAGSSMFGAAGLGVLGVVGLGATASAAVAAAVQANVVSAGNNAKLSTTSGNAVSANNQFTATLPTAGASYNTPFSTLPTPAEVVVKQAEVFSAPVLVVQGVQAAQTTITSTTTSSNASPVFVSSTPASPVTEVAPAVVKAVVISNSTSSKASSESTPASSSAPTTTATTSTDTTTTSSTGAGTSTILTLDYPVVIGETLPGTEDVVLRLSQDVLLANDSTPNASADPTARALTITAVADAVNGQVSLNDGVVVFMPNTNFHGEASFTYTVTDQYGLSTTGSATLVIAAVNDAPLTQGETAQTQEDTAIYFSVADLLSNDSDVDTATDGQVLSITGIAAAQHGTATLLADGRIRFVPDSNFHGTAQFTYIVNDGNDASNNGSTTAAVNVDVIAVNDAPVTQQDSSAVDEDTALVFTQAQLLANDSDVDTSTDGQVLTITAVSGATHGTVSMFANGDIRFIPNANYHGAASFTYTVSDGSGGTTDANVALTVLAVNDSPIAVDDVFLTQEDSAIVLTSTQLLANDTDNDIATDGDVLTISRVFDALHCTVTFNTDGTINLVPDAQYHGNVRFSYEITDASGATCTAFVVAGVSAVNDAPVSQRDSFDGTEDTLTILEQADVLANDTDSDILTDGDSLSVQSVGNATHGMVRLLNSGQIEFLPDANYHGLATFEYVVTDTFGATSTNTVTLSIGAVNDKPVVQAESTNTNEDTILYIAASKLLANDSDVDTITDGQVLSLSAVSSSWQTHGTVSLVTNADGTQTVQYTPDANYHGLASFNYTVSDGNGGYATALATINLASVNDAPMTVGEISSTDEDAMLTFTQAQLLANDSDVDTPTDDQVLSITAVSDAINGTVSLLSNGDICFIPKANYHGTASFTYTVSDGNGGITDASVDITVDAVNDTPVVQGESTNTNEDTTLLISAATLLSNDSDVDTTTDGQVLRLSEVNTISGHTHGSVTLLYNVDGTQTVEFIPDANYHGMAAFSYTVSDGNGGYATAVASINLAAVNDAPVTIGESSGTNEDVGLTFTQAQLLSNDSDVDASTDGQVLTITAVSGATNGTVSMQANGDIRFIPTANYHGTASFTYTVDDGNGGKTNALVTIAVNAVNDVPVVTGETVSTNEDTTLWFIPSDLLANDTDVDADTDGQVLNITAVSNAVHGAVAFVTQGDGKQRIVFTPEANYFGVASYQYTVNDGNGGAAIATVAINLSAVNDAPDALADSFHAIEDTPLTVASTSLLSNDTDVDNLHSALRVVGVSNATHGSVSLNADGSVSFRSNLDYFGVATFDYIVSDGVGGFSVGTASVNIEPVNDNPTAVGEILTLNEDETVSLTAASLLANDSDVDNSQAQLRIVSVGGAVHGSVSLETTNGNTHVVFKPELNFYGAASFTYTISDGVGGTADTRVELNLMAVNDIPVVNGELYVGKRDVSYSLSAAALLANDTDVETPNILTLSSVGNAQHGSANLVNGSIVFVPESGYSGLGSFDYVVCDADGGQATGTAQIDFSHVNLNPTVVDDSFIGTEDTSISITTAQLLANDADSDNAIGSLRVSQVGSATHGTVNLDAQGNVLFTPDANFNGQASFSYQVADPDGGSTWGNAWLTIASVNDAPIIEDVWYGRPVYGYHAVQLSGYDAEGYYSYTRYDVVTSLNDAMSFLHSSVQLYKEQIDLVPDGAGGFYSVKSYRTYSPTYYRNGDLRPISFDTLDATKWIDEGTTLTDDPYRQNGGVVAYDPDGDSGSLTFSISATPQHGHAWVNQYTNATAPEGQDYTQVDSSWVSQAGAWQYYSSKGDTYSGMDSFSLRVTDAGGASVDATVTPNHTSWPVGGGGGGGCPLVVDLDGDGVELIAASDSHVFEDVNGDGWRERMGWVSSDDGFLALDRNGDGLIEGMKDISFAHDLAGTQTDLMGLHAHDTNEDGVISCLDNEWQKFGIWQDANSNGMQDAGEFRSLDDIGVASIALAADNKLRLDHGNVVFGETQLILNSGKSWVTADVMFSGENVAYPRQVQDALLLQQAEVMRKALFFNQLCTTASSENDVMLGFVDTSDPSWHGLPEPSHQVWLDSSATG